MKGQPTDGLNTFFWTCVALEPVPEWYAAYVGLASEPQGRLSMGRKPVDLAQVFVTLHPLPYDSTLPNSRGLVVINH